MSLCSPEIDVSGSALAMGVAVHEVRTESSDEPSGSESHLLEAIATGKVVTQVSLVAS